MMPLAAFESGRLIAPGDRRTDADDEFLRMPVDVVGFADRLCGEFRTVTMKIRRRQRLQRNQRGSMVGSLVV